MLNYSVIFNVNPSFGAVSVLLVSIPSSPSLNRYHRVRPGNSRVRQLTRGTWSLGFPAAQPVHCRHSWHTGVIISSLFLVPRLMPCSLSHLPFPLTHQVTSCQRRLFCPPCRFINIYRPCPFLLLLSFLLFEIFSHSPFLPLFFYILLVCCEWLQSAASS